MRGGLRTTTLVFSLILAPIGAAGVAFGASADQPGRHVQIMVQFAEEALAAARAAANAQSVEDVKAIADAVYARVWGIPSGLLGEYPGAEAFHGWRTRWYISNPEGLGIMGHGRYVRQALEELAGAARASPQLKMHVPLAVAAMNNVIGWTRITTGRMHGQEQPRVSLTREWASDSEFWLSTADTGWLGEVEAQALNILKTDYEGDVAAARQHAAALARLIEKCLEGKDADGDGAVEPVKMEGGLRLTLRHAVLAGALGADAAAAGAGTSESMPRREGGA